MSLVLLGTEACHLCEEAQAVLVSLNGHIPFDIYLEDIAESEAMVERYGMRIPVLKYEAANPSQNAELDWPFNQQDVLDFIQTISRTLSTEK